MEIDENEIRQCKSCPRRFILSKGFYKLSDNSYRNDCKTCYNKKTAEYHKNTDLIARDGKFLNHYYGPEELNISYCQRCGVKRQKKAHPFKPGAWVVHYYVDKKWVPERPECVSKNMATATIASKLDDIQESMIMITEKTKNTADNCSFKGTMKWAE